MTKLDKIKKDLRDISLLDILRSKIFKYPSTFDNNCCLYDKWLSNFLISGVDVVSIDMHEMRIRSKETNKCTSIWVANYPYGYGNRLDVGPTHVHWGSLPNWNLVIELRKIQLTKKNDLINEYIEKQKILYQENLKDAKRREGEILASMACEIYNSPRTVNSRKINKS